MPPPGAHTQGEYLQALSNPLHRRVQPICGPAQADFARAHSPERADATCCGLRSRAQPSNRVRARIRGCGGGEGCLSRGMRHRGLRASSYEGCRRCSVGWPGGRVDCGLPVHSWLGTNQIRCDTWIDAFVVMPNHFHGIVGFDVDSGSLARGLDPEPRAHAVRPYLGRFVAGFKSACTHHYRELAGIPMAVCGNEASRGLCAGELFAGGTAEGRGNGHGA